MLPNIPESSDPCETRDPAPLPHRRHDSPTPANRIGSCATIFSASNYGGSMNQGATMRFSLNETDDSFAAGGLRWEGGTEGGRGGEGRPC